ncbi:hypothetical protein F0L68_04490 [Solihabitans fulvus]|uniref:Glycosyl transferase n=1 Tax=Solihabitans fulvus TaxID=1892852 RepID=A0A5B2XS81_9PSEU|nr:hypothetical protein [Solihabitans fulvus]KAA2265820.1 hypothetical protein F0L68_04490 [Solihabitans fulvus]
MNGVFTLWSAPKRERSPEFSPLDLLLLTLSVREWQRWNGRAILYCDRWYADCLDRIGLLGLWDEVDSTTIEDASALDVDATTFWTAGRLLALADAAVPFVSLDCDLITWRGLAEDCLPGEIMVTHWESTEQSPWYPSPGELHRPVAYRFDARRDWSLRAANVSLAYFGSDAVRQAYVEEALRFMVGNPGRPRPELGVAPELLFAEQRLLPLIAGEHGVPVRALVNATWAPGQDRFIRHDQAPVWEPLRVTGQHAGITHAWFYKARLQQHDPRRLRLRGELARRLQANYPDVADILARQPVS